MADQGLDDYSSNSNELEARSNSVIELNIRTQDSQTYSFQVDKNTTVSLFKDKIANEIGVPVGQQRLIFQGRVLNDDHPLSEYHLENGHTLHLVVRQPTQSRPSTDANSREANTNNGSQGNNAADGSPRYRVRLISHEVVFEIFNVENRADGAVPDISRVMEAVLNSSGIGSQPANNGTNIMQTPVFSNATGQAFGPNGSSETPASTDVHSQAGNHSQSEQAFSSQQFQSSPEVQSPLMSRHLPTIDMPSHDSLDILAELINHMEETLRQNGYQLDTCFLNTEDVFGADLPRNARDLPTAETLSVVVRSAQQLMGGSALAALSHVAGRLEQDRNYLDPGIRGQVQSETLQVGLAMENLGALFLELGRILLTLRMGQSPEESYVNAGPAVYISSSGLNPIMPESLPLQTSSSLVGGGASAVPQSNSTAVGTAPRPINVNIHARTTHSPIVIAVGNQQHNSDAEQRDQNNMDATRPGAEQKAAANISRVDSLEDFLDELANHSALTNEHVRALRRDLQRRPQQEEDSDL